MPAYIPNASETTQPTEDKTVESAALEFRTLKARVAGSLRVPEAGVSDVPATAARAGKVLGFDASGNPSMVTVAGTTDPSLRADLAASNGVTLVGGITPFAQTVLDDADAVAARATLGVPSLAGTGASGTWPVSVTGSAGSFAAATTTSSGIVELATDAEAQSGAGSTVVTASNLGEVALGVNQNWSGVLSTRSLGTHYQNTTGRPIMVIVSVNVATSGIMTVSYNSTGGAGGNIIAQCTAASAETHCVSFIVPAGGAYTVSATGASTKATWNELV